MIQTTNGTIEAIIDEKAIIFIKSDRLFNLLCAYAVLANMENITIQNAIPTFATCLTVLMELP